MSILLEDIGVCLSWFDRFCATFVFRKSHGGFVVVATVFDGDVDVEVGIMA